MPHTDTSLLQDVERYYSGRVREFGATARGVDWNSAESQHLRFEQLARVWDGETGVVDMLDYGCGYGALVDYLRARGSTIRYQGFDVSAEMIGNAAGRAATDCSFTTRPDALRAADYVVASGIFNVRLTHDVAAWEAYMHRTLADMRALARRGFAFNALTSYADKDKQRPDLYYADPLYWFDLCKRTYSSRITLLHDYPLYEFTLLVRLTDQP
jgi:SAM-dependent methyltransferase